jgi:ATP-dependent helicase/nuclease subunit A
MKVDELIQRIYSETGLPALAARGGSKENLMLLYNYAKKFESSSFEGLYSFINYVNTVIESGASFPSGKDGETGDAVSILTVHKSKGLEYPIVFLADAATSLTSQNERKTKIAYSDLFGPAAKLRSPGGLALVESTIYNVIVESNIHKSIEEELRGYYVALTKARERLFIVGAPDTPTKEKFLCEA